MSSSCDLTFESIFLLVPVWKQLAIFARESINVAFPIITRVNIVPLTAIVLPTLNRKKDGAKKYMHKCEHGQNCSLLSTSPWQNIKLMDKVTHKKNMSYHITEGGTKQCNVKMVWFSMFKKRKKKLVRVIVCGISQMACQKISYLEWHGLHLSMPKASIPT